jgi:hypothetical protein
MEMSKIKFYIAMALAGASVMVMALANKGFKITTEMAIVIGLSIAGISFLVLLLKKYNSISFLRNVREKPKQIVDEATRRLCGFSKFVAYSDFILFESPDGKFTGHAYILLEKLPYMIEQMSKETQLNITASFSRLLGKFNHPFTYMPICRPVDRTRFTKNIQHKIHNLRVSISVSKVADPKQEIEERILTEQLKKLSEGESPLEILFLVQIREKGTTEEIKNKLNMHSEAMINNLEVIHQVRARRLSNTDMIDAVQNFFMLGSGQ